MLRRLEIVNAKRWVDGEGYQPASLIAEAGEIVELGRAVEGSSDSFDARGALLLPGVVDAFVDAGTIFASPDQPSRLVEAGATYGLVADLEVPSTPERLRSIKSQCASRTDTPIGILASVTESTFQGLKALWEEALAICVSTCGPSETAVEDEATLSAIFEEASELARPLWVHAQSSKRVSERLRGDTDSDFARAHGATAEIEAVDLCIRLAREFETSVHFACLSTAGSVDLVEDAKADGLPITAGTFVHHLVFDDEDARKKKDDSLLSVPPLKSTLDRERLREGVREGVIDVVSSGTRSKPSSRCLGLSSSCWLLPTMLSLTSEGVFDMGRTIACCIEAPSRVLGLFDRGTLRSGASADFCLIDLDASKEVASGSSRGYGGQRLVGWPLATIVKGRWIAGDAIDSFQP